MKLFDSGEINLDNGNFRKTPYVMVGELPNHMLIKNTISDKGTLAPEFLGHSHICRGVFSKFLLPHSDWTIQHWGERARNQGYFTGPVNQNFNHGKGLNNHLKNGPMGQYWISKFNPNEIFIFEYLNNANITGNVFLTKYDANTLEVLQRNSTALGTANQMPGAYIYHEDEDWLYCVGAAGYNINQHTFRLSKNDLLTHEYYGLYHERLQRTLLWDNPSTGDYIFWTSAHYYANTSNYTGFHRMQHGVGNPVMGFYEDLGTNESVYTFEHPGRSDHPNYPMYDGDGSGGTTLRTEFGGWMQSNGHRMSDDTEYNDVDREQYFLKHPAVYNDGALTNTHGFVRVWAFEWMNSGQPNVLRYNVPVKDPALANVKGVDVRKTTINWNGKEQPNQGNNFGSSGLGNSTYAYQAHVMHYWKDTSNNKEYLLLHGVFTYALYYASQGDYRNNKLWMFEITDNTDANDRAVGGLSLKCVDVITCSKNLSLLHFLNQSLNSMITVAAYGDGASQIWNWDSNAQTFSTNASLNGEIAAIGEDSYGRIWTQRETELGSDYHVESIDLPSIVIVEPAQSSYEYTGSDIASTVAVSVQNHLGSLVNGATVSLQIVGDGMVFVDSNGISIGKTTTVTSDGTGAKDVNIKITSPTLAQINASITV